MADEVEMSAPITLPDRTEGDIESTEERESLEDAERISILPQAENGKNFGMTFCYCKCTERVFPAEL